jgi:3-oxoacyl-(acyl-carrier-protein) synthase
MWLQGLGQQVRAHVWDARLGAIQAAGLGLALNVDEMKRGMKAGSAIEGWDALQQERALPKRQGQKRVEPRVKPLN